MLDVDQASCPRCTAGNCSPLPLNMHSGVRQAMRAPLVATSSVYVSGNLLESLEPLMPSLTLLTWCVQTPPSPWVARKRSVVGTANDVTGF